MEELRVNVRRNMPAEGLPYDIELWRNVSDATLHAVGRAVVSRRYSVGEPIYTPAGGSGKVYIVLSGRVSVFRMLDGGKKMIIDVLGPNDIFGDIHKLLSGHGSGDQVYGANMNRLNGDENFAEAVSDCLIGVANKEDFFVMLSNNPEMGVRVIESLGRRLRVTESKVKEMAMQNVGDRIVTELVRMYLRYGAKRCGEWLLLEHKFTHEALGNLIGVSREAVTRNLAALSRRGLVKHSKGYFRIHRSLIKKTDENN